MPKVEYEWAPGERPPAIRQHSIAKHEILHAYLIAYLKTLVAFPQQKTFKLTLVDGFSGGGIYRHATTGGEVLGSPFVMIHAVQEANALINQRRSKSVNLDIDYIFIEASRAAHKVLIQEMTNRGYLSEFNNSISIRNSRFEDEAANIINRIKIKSPMAGRAIFLLDQYGYSQVPTTLINSIFKSLPGAEVILTFAVDSFLNFASDGSSTPEILRRIGIPDIFRGRTLDEIKRSERDWRLFIQSCMYQDLVRACGARFYTPFFIRSTHGHGDYWLIHLSQRHRARDVMARIHWEKNNYFIHYGGPGMNMFSMLGYVPDKDSSFTGQGELNLGFTFDEAAKVASVEALMEHIPRLIYPDPDGMSFSALFASTCNDSPACGLTYREAISNLIKHHEIEVVSQDGTRRQAAGAIHESDQILAPRQGRFRF